MFGFFLSSTGLGKALSTFLVALFDVHTGGAHSMPIAPWTRTRCGVAAVSPACGSDAVTALLLLGSLAVVAFRRTILLWVGCTLAVLLVLAALLGGAR